MVLVPLVLAPLLMLAAVHTEQRRGASAGGWVAALPVSFTVAVLAVTLDGGARTGERLAASAGAHVAAQVLFGVGFAAGLRRAGPAWGAAGGVAAYGGGSLLVAALPTAVAIAAAVPALLVAPRLVPARTAPAAGASRPATTALVCLGAAIVVGVTVLGSRSAGPEVGGALAAFPLVSGLFVLVAVGRGGPAAGVGVLAGLVRSLPCYLTFCVLVATTVGTLGLAAVPLALAACAAMGRVTWRALGAGVPTPAAA